MNKEEILAMSRKENKNKDLVDKAIENKSITVAGTVMVIMCVIYYMAEFILLGRRNSGFFSVAAVYNATLFMMKGVKLKDKNKLVTGIIWLAVAVGITVEHLYFIVTNSAIF